MFADLGVSKAVQAIPQPDVCSFFIQAGQATIPCDIGSKDGRKAPFNAIVGQNGLPRSIDPLNVSKHEVPFRC
jgi:hypothetical protein